MRNDIDRTWSSILHYFLLSGSVSDILINYTLIILYSAILYYPWSSNLLISKLLTTLHIVISTFPQSGSWQMPMECPLYEKDYVNLLLCHRPKKRLILV